MKNVVNTFWVKGLPTVFEVLVFTGEFYDELLTCPVIG